MIPALKLKATCSGCGTFLTLDSAGFDRDDEVHATWYVLYRPCEICMNKAEKQGYKDGRVDEIKAGKGS